MKLTQILAPAVGLFAVANAWGETAVWTTVVETDYTTYCPSPTTFAWHNVTYTATTETTLTITNCPCTVTYSQPPPVTITSYPPSTFIPTGTAPVPSYPYSNVSSTVITYTPTPSTYISGTVPITTTPGAPGAPGVPTNVPIPPTTTFSIPPTSSGPVVIPTAAAGKVGPVGALLAVGIAALAL
ncbi:hypothetical protein F5Y00DRAFT_12946 [Daldinia vernicosa]|uniref:uncharacterized protein n=1 Tax=Daldinia vernicosa TaxID=114800 RepID=UPI002007521A|nr:uncharacterized protein F5Y00DRAFT_12946 [Daldinia vernicosa]KAI0851576.1 hypothetical protein F5Y00DRAFT_12946 [Daldinia vernicosa]